jgi:hypothetical protein
MRADRAQQHEPGYALRVVFRARERDAPSPAGAHDESAVDALSGAKTR